MRVEGGEGADGHVSSTSGLGIEPEFSSFRDRAGFVFRCGGTIFRCVDHRYNRQYRHAVESGLFASCVADGLLLPFEEYDQDFGLSQCHAVLKPVLVPQITWPYEWCFEQLKDAALVTLRAHLRALQHGMLLKDASSYNVQMVAGRPCLIDHLSFDFAADHVAWPAYGQFCRHFLAPLALMSRVDGGLGRMLQLHLDGIPLDLAARLLPFSTRFAPGLLMHLHLHARTIGRHAGASQALKRRGMTIAQFSAIAASLEQTVRHLRFSERRTEWGDYDPAVSYSSAAEAAKLQSVRTMAESVNPGVIWDVGGNDGTFSRPLADLAQSIVCMDADPAAVNRNYLECKKAGATNVQPIIFDVGNPSPSIGFANRERLSLAHRGKPDLVLALALIHHLAITHNLPLGYVSNWLASLCRNLIIEFVPKEDKQVGRLLLNRADVFDDYNEAGFRAEFSRHFDIERAVPIAESQRILFLMRRKG